MRAAETAAELAEAETVAETTPNLVGGVDVADLPREAPPTKPAVRFSGVMRTAAGGAPPEADDDDAADIEDDDEDDDMIRH